jgi:energy-coupling factor transporter ATP-binding protein EcfA2
MLALSITALDKGFRAGTCACFASVRVLRGFELAIWPGETILLAGAPGSGKTTVLQCAGGLLQPDAGTISWFGARTAPRAAVAYVSAGGSRDTRRACAPGALHARVAAALDRGARLLLVDDLDAVGTLEQRVILHLIGDRAARGAAAMFASSSVVADDSRVSRVVTLDDGAIDQRRKRSATRIAASSFASRARASARSTYGRSFRSPQ